MGQSEQTWTMVQTLVLPPCGNLPGEGVCCGVHPHIGLPPETQQTNVLAHTAMASLGIRISCTDSDGMDSPNEPPSLVLAQGDLSQWRVGRQLCHPRLHLANPSPPGKSNFSAQMIKTNVTVTFRLQGMISVCSLRFPV